MPIPQDVHDNTSARLSAVIEAVLDDDNIRQPATLASVRLAILGIHRSASPLVNRFCSDQPPPLRDEIEALIDAYGRNALAVRFARPWAEQPLARLITAGVDESGTLTLGGLLDAAESGLLARLVGQGELDDDEVQTTLADLQQLIERHGANALAEEYLGSH
jgi:hypothetical protein